MIAIAPFNGGGAGSLIAVAELDGTRIVTDGTWKTLPGITATPPAGWNTPGFDDSAWVAAKVTGAYGIGALEPERPDAARTHRPARRQRCRASSPARSIRIDTGAEPGGEGDRERRHRRRERVRPHAHHAADDRACRGRPGRQPHQPDTGISFTPALDQPHAAGALVTGSGNNIAASDPSAGAAVTPRMIARLEVTYANGSTDVVVSDRSWRTAFGAYVTDAWYAGSDYDARREQVGWDAAGADLSGDREASGRHRCRLDRRRDRSAAQPRDTARGPRRAAGADRRGVRSQVGDEPNARNVRLRLRAELRRLAAAEPHHPGARGHRDPDVSGRGAEQRRVGPGQPGIARAERRPRHQHVQHVHGRWRRAGDVASRLPVLRDAVPPGHRAPRGLPRDDGPHHRTAAHGRHPVRRLRDHLERAGQPDPPDGPVLVRQQHAVDLHRLPRSREAVLPGRLHDGDGGDRAQPRARLLPAWPHAPLRRGSVDGRHLHARQRGPEGARP